uniref:DNA topoisomerase n=1 Tax=Strigamia maritima TaxID=126957 RepID=T1JEW7_STRMM
MKTVLMVAEKPSLAQSLSQILSNGRMGTRRGFNNACSVHEWNGSFKGEQAKFKMTSVCGHVMTTDFPGKYNNWDRVDPVELFQCPTEKKEATVKLQMPKFLQVESRGCDYLVLWLDCDKEGENICFEVINCVQSSMPISLTRDRTVFRAKFSAITEKDIKKAMDTLVDPNENEARSVDARQELDLRIGCAFTRFQTKFFHGKYGNLDSSLISYGPCQTPTLGFCVERHDAIQTFKPEPFWTINVQVMHAEKKMNLEWERIRLFDREVIQLFLNNVKNAKQATVESRSKKEKVKQRPQALNTVELMRVASAGLGMSPHHAMQIAERLYTQGYISYPRTETTQYPANFDLLGTLKQQSSNQHWGNEVKELINEGIHSARKGHDVGDHPPITPMKSANQNDLEGDAWRLYDYITRHFIATITPDCRYMVTTLTFTINEEKFSCNGKNVIDPGYTKFMTWQAIHDDEALPDLAAGCKCDINEVKLGEGQTSPPGYLSESELITLMEKHGIGTDASIPVHINNICQRNYVVVESGRRLVPTTLGIVLVHGYQKIDPDLVLPTMRTAVEEQLNLIAQGKQDFEAVLQHTLTVFKLKFLYFVTNITGMDELFEVSFSSLADSGKAFSRCGKCRRYMKYVSTKPSRLFCGTCDETYNVPQNGIIKVYKELKCPLDEFELLLWSGGTKGKSFPFCPYCFNNPPFRDMRKGGGCNSCTHQTCVHALNSTGVSNCFECEGGVLVLDPSSGPKWKLGCNKCDVIIHLFEDAQKLSVDDETCEECGSQIVTVEYKSEKSKLPDNATEASGCVFCESQFSSLVEKQHATIKRNNMRGRGGSRGGRGRGGRGRGKGRGRGRPKDKMAQLAAYFT